jgi:hypothetical protein
MRDERLRCVPLAPRRADLHEAAGMRGLELGAHRRRPLAEQRTLHHRLRARSRAPGGVLPGPTK